MAGPWRVRFVHKSAVPEASRTAPLDLLVARKLGYMPWIFFAPSISFTRFEHDVGGVLAACPFCGRWYSVHFPPFDQPQWQWNHNADRPTLSPSVHARREDGGCGMHLWVTDGQIIDAGTPPH